MLTELRTLHHSTCPFIVSFYGAFYKERSISLILEYMDVGSLSQLLKSLGKLDETTLAFITVQVSILILFLFVCFLYFHYIYLFIYLLFSIF